MRDTRNPSGVKACAMTSLLLPLEMAHRIEQVASERGMPKAQFIRLACERLLSSEEAAMTFIGQ